MLVFTYSRVQVILLLPVMPVFKTLHKKGTASTLLFLFFKVPAFRDRWFCEFETSVLCRANFGSAEILSLKIVLKFRNKQISIYSHKSPRLLHLKTINLQCGLIRRNEQNDMPLWLTELHFGNLYKYQQITTRKTGRELSLPLRKMTAISYPWGYIWDPSHQQQQTGTQPLETWNVLPEQTRQQIFITFSWLHCHFHFSKTKVLGKEIWIWIRWLKRGTIQWENIKRNR